MEPRFTPRGIDRPLVLVVDDDSLTREALSEILVTAEYRVVLAPNGFEAITHLHERAQGGELPDLILLDLVMPVDGWEFRKQQQQEPLLATIPVVVMSGVYQPGPAAESLGAAAALRKPVDVRELLEVVRLACSRALPGPADMADPA